MAASASAKLTAVITGASRGIGLGLVEAYVAKGYRVVAAVRDPSKADKLNALIKAHGAAAVQAVKLDVSDAKSIAALPAALAALQPAVSAVDVLINNAGIISPGAAKAQGGVTTLATETEADLAAVFHTNVIGVFSVTNALLPLLRAVKSGAKVVNIGSILGSVDFIVNGPWPPGNPAYLISKSALNQLSAIQARAINADAESADAKDKAAAKPLITVVSMHPGWVDTDMGTSGGGKPPVTVPQSAGGIEQVVSKLKPQGKVAYLDFEGKTLNW